MRQETANLLPGDWRMKNEELTPVELDEILELAKPPQLCERCYYDDADPEASVADDYQDRYQALCKPCAAQLNRLQAKREGWK